MGVQASCAVESPTCEPECQQMNSLMCDDVVERKYKDVKLLAGARDGNVGLAAEAIRDGAFLETRQPMRIMAGLGPDPTDAEIQGPTPLMLAAKSGSSDCVKLLLEKGAKVHAMDEDGMRPVHWAALSGDVCILRLLVDAGADPTILDEDGHHVLDHLPQEIASDPAEYKKWLGMTGQVTAPLQTREQRAAYRDGEHEEQDANVQPREKGRNQMGLQGVKLFAAGGVNVPQPHWDHLEGDEAADSIPATVPHVLHQPARNPDGV